MPIKDFYGVRKSSEELYDFLKNLNISQEEKDKMYHLIEAYCGCKIESAVDNILSSL